MNYQQLFEKYNFLIKEVNRLSEENNRLKAKLGEIQTDTCTCKSGIIDELSLLDDGKPTHNSPLTEINNKSDTISKIKLFMSLFKGRDDVYATRWENKRKATSGYSPVCLNQWQVGLCGKPKVSCSKCANKLYATLDEHVIDDHLRGNIVAGIYPMLPDETCYFLAMDFDEVDWQKDVLMVRDVCSEFNIPVAVERSQSGNGGHVWCFFEDRLSAALARKFGTALLTYSMNKRHEIQFKSYDRLFPNQDTMPKGGLGNLIALPFQKAVRENNNSEFINERFESYSDQWSFLSSIQKISEDRINSLISDLCHGPELGILKIDEEDMQKPWETHKINLAKKDFPKQIEIVKANMLYVPKVGISQRALNRLKRLASYKNPMFFRHQAMRLSTFGHPRIISCADETEEYLCLPRGCDIDLVNELEQYKVDAHFIDKTNHGKSIDADFNGQLREEQPLALEKLLSHDIGILSGTTAFGKTVVAIKLIAERKVNTLILVDKISLLSQWRDRLTQFLIINETLPEPPVPTAKKRGGKKKTSIIGQLGAGKNSLSGIVDIAVVQSLSRKGEVKNYVKNYGMIIADECHHASAFTYEQILKTTNAKYIYGLTATPTRKDGHHPILLMHCGPIRYRDNPKKQAEKRPFDHYIIPRFTSLRIPLDKDEKDASIQELYSEIADSDFRNQQIVEDAVNSYRLGRNCLILSQRTAHVELLSKKIKEEIPDVLTLMGNMGTKRTKEIFKSINNIPDEETKNAFWSFYA